MRHTWLQIFCPDKYVFGHPDVDWEWNPLSQQCNGILPPYEDNDNAFEVYTRVYIPVK